MKKITLLMAAALGVLATPALLAQMNDGAHRVQHQTADAQTETAASLPEPVQTVWTNYLKIQTALAEDSLQGVKDSAVAIMESIRADSTKTFSAGVAQAAEDLAKTTNPNLGGARQMFRRLSGYLILSLNAHPEHAGHFLKVFCPKLNVMWLQADSVVNNPYLGKSMARCGRIVS